MDQRAGRVVTVEIELLPIAGWRLRCGRDVSFYESLRDAKQAALALFGAERWRVVDGRYVGKAA